MPFDNFKHLFPVSKTVCVPLFPTPASLDHIKQHIEEGEQIKAYKPLITAHIDKTFREIIRRGLQQASAQQQLIEKATAKAIEHKRLKADKEASKDQKDVANEEAYNACGIFSNAIREAFDNDALYQRATAGLATLFNDLLIPMAENPADGSPRDEELISALRKMRPLAEIYRDFITNRKTLISGFKKGSISYRAAYENLGIYAANAVAWERAKVLYPGIEDTANDLTGVIPDNTATLEEMLEHSYARFLTQEGIDRYNALINGWTEEGIHHKGLRMLITEAAFQDTKDGRPRNKEERKNAMKKMPVVKSLNKQILSPETGISFKPTQYETDEEAWKDIFSFIEKLKANDTAGSGKVILENLSIYDGSKIAIKKRHVEMLSKLFLGRYDTYKEGIPKKDKGASNGAKSYTLDQLSEIFQAAGLDTPLTDKIGAEYTKAAVLMQEAYASLQDIHAIGQPLSSGEKQYNGKIKEDLELIKKGRDILAIFETAEEKDTDEQLYYDLQTVLGVWNRIIPIYNGVRSVCTRKPYKTDKNKVIFGNEKFGTGWSGGRDGNNFITKGNMVIFKDDQIYVVAFPRDREAAIQDAESSNIKKFPARKIHYTKSELELTPGCRQYQRMSIESIGLADKFDRIMFSERGMKDNAYPEHLVPFIRNREYVKAEANKEKLCELIAFCQTKFTTQPSLKLYPLPVNDPDSYGSWKEFLEDIDRYALVRNTTPVNADALDKAEREGRALLFRLGGLGLRQMTLNEDGYTKSILVRNLVDALKGNGDTVIDGAFSLYYRRQSLPLENTVIHRKGDWLVCRHTLDGEAVPNDIRTQIRLAYKNGTVKALSDEAKAWLGRMQPPKQAKYDIVKDRRYTQDRYSGHFSLTLGAGIQPKGKDFHKIVNDQLKEWLQAHPKCNILGINRGENNLLYLTLVNADGTILEQKNLNIIDTVDYKSILRMRTREGLDKIRNWQDRDTIKEIKDGYLSKALSEVTSIAFRNEAVIAIENLDEQFLRDRNDLGETIYRKFRTMLIDKLRWYVPDKRHPEEVWQLASGTDKESKGSKKNDLAFPHRNGIVFTVAPWATSDLDPVTGFRPMLPLTKARTAEEQRKFVAKLKGFVKDKDGHYKVAFDYADYKDVAYPGTKTEWTVSSEGPRLTYAPDQNPEENWAKVKVEYPTQTLDDILGNPEPGDILKTLDSLDSEKFDKIIRAIKVICQVRNCSQGAKTDFFLSPVKGGLDTRSKRQGYPATTDAVTAYNMTMKARLMIDEGLDKVDNETWLSRVQNKKITLPAHK